MSERLMALAGAPIARREFPVFPEPMIPAGTPSMQAPGSGFAPLDTTDPVALMSFRAGQGRTVEDTSRLYRLATDAALNFAGTTPMASRSAASLMRGVDPQKLLFRESVQNRIDEVSRMFPEGEGYPPIVAAQTPDGLLILDGHNRASVARQRGDVLDAVVVPESVYRGLLARKLDEVDISHAALGWAGQDDAASAIRQQFSGVRWENTEREAFEAFGRFEDGAP